MRRLWAAGAAIVMCLTLGGVPAVAQEPSSEPSEVTTELMFEVTLPPGVMSDELQRINTGGLTVAPGVEAAIGTDNEAIRGRLLYVESGEIVVTPMVDSPVWLGGAALGGSPGVAPTGEAVRLEPGDLIFLPVIAAREVVPPTTIANPDTEPAVLRGFHAHARGGGFPGWPTGIADNEGAAEAGDQEVIAAIMADGATFRSTRLTAPVGSPLPLDDAALFTLVDVYEGKVERTATGPEGETPSFWNPIKGGYVPTSPDWTFNLTVAGDSAAIVNEMAVLPAASGAAPTESPTSAQEASPTVGHPDLVTGTEACGSRSDGITSYVAGVTRERGLVAECVNTMSDPRVDGTYVNTVNEDCYQGGFCVLWGTHILDKAEGGWDCSWSATEYPVWEDFLVLGVCPGTGGFEGLTYVFQHATADFGDGSTFHGVIYEGRAPAIYEMPAPGE
jgi:hypothetical protein